MILIWFQLDWIKIIQSFYLKLVQKVSFFVTHTLRYAANDVLTAMAILFKMIIEQQGVCDYEALLEETYDVCLQHKDIPFKGKEIFFKFLMVNFSKIAI